MNELKAKLDEVGRDMDKIEVALLEQIKAARRLFKRMGAPHQLAELDKIEADILGKELES